MASDFQKEKLLLRLTEFKRITHSLGSLVNNKILIIFGGLATQGKKQGLHRCEEALLNREISARGRRRACSGGTFLHGHRRRTWPGSQAGWHGSTCCGIPPCPSTAAHTGRASPHAPTSSSWRWMFCKHPKDPPVPTCSHPRVGPEPPGLVAPLPVLTPPLPAAVPLHSTEAKVFSGALRRRDRHLAPALQRCRGGAVLQLGLNPLQRELECPCA